MKSDKVHGGRLLRRPDVLKVIPLGDTQFDAKVRSGEFPAPVKLSDSGRAVAWLEEEVIAYRDARIRKRDAELRRRSAGGRKAKQRGSR